VSLMQERREVKDRTRLCRGPACLVSAMGITASHNGMYLPSECLRVELGSTGDNSTITVTSRVGISKAQDLPLRYYIADSPFVSFPR
jgi:DNA-3-methyladenine glycosylase